MCIRDRPKGDPQVQFLTFRPYFHAESFPFIRERDEDFFGCGRISRQDADKFAANTLHIYGCLLYTSSG